MKATELTRTELGTNDADEKAAESTYGISRPRLTLRHLHRLRLIRELQRLEAQQQRQFVAHMYGGNFEKSDEKEQDSRNPPKSVKPPKPFKPLETSSKYLDKHTRS